MGHGDPDAVRLRPSHLLCCDGSRRAPTLSAHMGWQSLPGRLGGRVGGAVRPCLGHRSAVARGLRHGVGCSHCVAARLTPIRLRSRERAIRPPRGLTSNERPQPCHNRTMRLCADVQLSVHLCCPPRLLLFNGSRTSASELPTLRYEDATPVEPRGSTLLSLPSAWRRRSSSGWPT
jgi:hypothetical protein